MGKRVGEYTPRKAAKVEGMPRDWRSIIELHDERRLPGSREEHGEARRRIYIPKSAIDAYVSEERRKVLA